MTDRRHRWRTRGGARTRALCVVVLMGLALAACSTGPAQDPPAPPKTSSAPASPSASLSESPSSSPSATAPALPDAARGTSPRAAKAFVRHYVELLNFAAASGDTTEARLASLSACESCESILAKVDAVYGKGGSIDGEGWDVISIKYQPLQSKENPVVLVNIFVNRQVMTERSGEAPQVFRGGRNQLTLELRHRRDSWGVRRLERLA